MRLLLPVVACAVSFCGCRSAPLVVEGGGGGVVFESYVPDPDTGRLVRELERGDVTVVFDSVAVEGGLLTLTGRAEIEGRGGYGSALLVEGYRRTGIPEAPPPPERPGPYPWAGPPLADGALAYGATLYRGGRFALRAPLAEAERDTVLIAYGEYEDWVRVPVADVVAGRRFWASAPGAVPNPEARGWDGLRLRPTSRQASAGDSVRFVLSYRPPPVQARQPLGSLDLGGLNAVPDSGEVRSPSFGTGCLWRVERWAGTPAAGGWEAAPEARLRDAPDGLVTCEAIGLAFSARGERREAFRLRPDAAPGRYRWCLDAHVERDGAVAERLVCSTAFVVEAR